MKTEKIAAEIIDRAHSFGYDCFVFGEEVYSMDEAREAIIEYGADEIADKFSGDVEAYKDYIFTCASKREE